MKRDTQQALTSVEQSHARAAVRAANHWQKSSASISKTLGSIKGLMLGSLGALGVAGVGKGILDAGKEYERLQAALSTAMGGDAQAKKAFKEIETFARKTPYELTEVADAFIKLKNLGLDPSQVALTSYGNTAGAMGKPLMQMIEAVADASTGEFERLKEFGIKAKQQGDKVAFTFRGVTTVVSKNAKDIEKYLFDLGNKQFAGGMAKQAATIGGMLSTMSDNFQALARSVWTAGAGDGAKAFVKWVTDATDRLLPLIEKHLPKIISQAAELGKEGLKYANQGFKALEQVLPVVGAGLLGIGTGMLYIKAAALADWLIKAVMAWRAMDAAQKAAAISGAIANATVLAIPIAIGLAVAAVGWFGYQVWRYMTGGEKAIEGLRERFPWLADAVRWVGVQFHNWMPTIQAIAGFVGTALVSVLGVLWEVVKAGFNYVIKPYFMWWIGIIQTVGKWLSTAYDFWMPKLVSAFYYWKDALGEVEQNFTNFWNLLKEIFGWIPQAVETAVSKIGGIGDAIKGVLSWIPGFGGGDAGAGAGTLSGPTALNQDQGLASRLARASMGIVTRAGQCLNAVWRTQQAVMAGKSPITARHAADAAAQLARSGQFQEITGITPAMLNDPKYKKILHGATVVYDRASGFSKVSGHAEIWDMINGVARFGTGAKSLKHRTAQNLAHARFFIPVQAGTGGKGAANVQQIINVNISSTNASPAQIAAAVRQGAGQANATMNKGSTSVRVQTIYG